ncbi:MAG: hypothetical protein IPF55_08870 [Rhodoferax sp.]|nr:hypothetical protein [Rhodoferax sp.]
MIHGSEDSLIAPRHSDALKAVAPRAGLLRIAGAGHNDLQDFDAYRSGFADALSRL